MPQLLAIALGGAVGALLRFGAIRGVETLAGRDLPYGTLTVNVIGSFLVGLLTILLVDRLSLDPVWRLGLLVGVLGAFTTFSTFSMETMRLLESGRTLAALGNAASSVAFCLVATWIGLSVGRQL